MRKKNEITEYVAAALIFVCAVAVSLGIFLVCTQNSIERNSQKVIKTNVSRQSEHIKAILDIHYGYLWVKTVFRYRNTCCLCFSDF